MAFYTFLPKILNMSLTASVAIVFILLLRLLLKKAPKVISYALWSVVLIRLLCPVSIESGLSLFGLFDTPTVDMTEHSSAVEYIPPSIVHTEFPEVVLPVPGIGEAITEALPQGEEQLRADPLEGPMFIATYIWWGGILVMAVYGLVTYLRLRRRLITASPLRDNIYLADDIDSPFVMGLIRPKIYLPSAMEEREQSYILLHEQHHIRRLDHVVKALAFVALCIHWFNPLVWVAFILSGKDMEMSCDEAVVRKLGTQIRADYTASLLSLATGKRIIAGMPLAFGEGNTKGRIKNLANWKKPAFGVVVLAIIACVVVAICLLTNPVGFQFDEASYAIVSANHFDMRTAGDAVAVEMNSSQISELSSRLSGVKKTKKSDEYGGLTPGYQISVCLEDGTYIRISGYSLSDNNMVDIEWNGERYVVSDEEFQDYLSRICAGGDVSSAGNAVAGKTYLYEGEGIMGSFTITLYNDGTFTYYEGMASSYIGIGSWEQDGDTITLTDDGHGGYGLVNHFKLDGDDLVFVDKDSANFVYVKVQDGEKFHCTGEAFKQNDGADGTVQIMPNRNLSLNDVIMLSQKGYDLTWSDFDQFKYIETGSGLYIRVYEINEMYELWIGGSWIDEDPMYIYLALADDLDTRIDIRDGGVTDFIGADHSSVLLSKAINEAILSENKPSKPDGLYHCASFVLLDQKELSGTPTVDSSDHTQMVTVYGLALHQGFGYSGGTLHDVSGSHIPVAITFEIVGGKYVLKEYWTPRDGSYYVQDVRDKFPDEVEDEALDTQKYILAQKQTCYDQGVRYGGVDTYSAVEHLFEVIESSPATSSRPADYIDAHSIEYRELMYYGDYTLQYIFSKFHLEGNQTGLRGHLMRIALDDLAPEAQLRLHAETGQAYFDEWRAGAIRISEQHDME